MSDYILMKKQAKNGFQFDVVEDSAGIHLLVYNHGYAGLEHSIRYYHNDYRDREQFVHDIKALISGQDPINDEWDGNQLEEIKDTIFGADPAGDGADDVEDYSREEVFFESIFSADTRDWFVVGNQQAIYPESMNKLAFKFYTVPAGYDGWSWNPDLVRAGDLMDEED